MGEGLFRELCPPGTEVHEHVVSILIQLEDAGWMPQKLIGGRAIAYWPENGRSRQIRIDLRYPPNEQKLEFYREHTQIDLVP